MDIIRVIFFTIFNYFYLIFIIRIMGKREVGSLSIFDLAVYFTISDLITIAILDDEIPLYLSIISVAVLALLQILIAKITLKNKKIRDLIDGKKTMIIDDGKIDFEQMKKQRYTIDDLYTQIREKGVDSVTMIKWGILEPNGKLSIILYKDSVSNFPDPLISDGIIITENLKKINMDEKYLLSKVKEANVKSIKDVNLCIYVDNKLSFIFKK